MAFGRRQVGILLVLLGLATLVYSAFRGDLRVGLFLIVPYAYGSGLLPFLGFVLLIAGAFLWMTSGFERVSAGERTPEGDAYAYRGAEPPHADSPNVGGGARSERRVKHGGFVMIGPIPIVWGNDKRMLPWLIILGLGLFALMLLLPLLLR